MFTGTHTWAALALGVGVVIGCQSRQNIQTEHRQAKAAPETVVTAASTPASDQASAPVGTIGQEELRNLLADFARSHADKIKLSGWAGTPFLPVGNQFKPFFQEMSRSNKELAAELKDWAKKRGMDLTHRRPDTVEGRATQMLEERHEKMIRADDQQNFERDILMEMFNDYEWRACLCRAMIPAVTDPELKSYLQKLQAASEKGAVESRMLLKRYKFH